MSFSPTGAPRRAPTPPDHCCCGLIVVLYVYIYIYISDCIVGFVLLFFIFWSCVANFWSVIDVLGVDGVYGFGSGGPRTRQWHSYPDPGVKRRRCRRVEDRIELLYAGEESIPSTTLLHLPRSTYNSTDNQIPPFPLIVFWKHALPCFQDTPNH